MKNLKNKEEVEEGERKLLFLLLRLINSLLARQQPKGQTLHKLNLTGLLPGFGIKKLSVRTIQHHVSSILVGFVNKNEAVSIRGTRNWDEKRDVVFLFA